MVCSGISPDYRLVEIVEIPDHPYFIATQFHPEFKSRPNRAHALFRGLVEAALKHRAAGKGQTNGRQAVVSAPAAEQAEPALEASIES
jgi:CTP synthase